MGRHWRHLLHRGLVKLVQVQRVDAVLGPEDEVLVCRETVDGGWVTAALRPLGPGGASRRARLLPLVSGWIHDVAQVIFSGQPSNTLEKQAPIWKRTERSARSCLAAGGPGGGGPRRSTHQDFRGRGQTVDGRFLKGSRAHTTVKPAAGWRGPAERVPPTGNSFLSFLCWRLGGRLGPPPFTSSSESLSVRGGEESRRLLDRESASRLGRDSLRGLTFALGLTDSLERHNTGPLKWRP